MSTQHPTNSEQTKADKAVQRNVLSTTQIATTSNHTNTHLTYTGPLNLVSLTVWQVLYHLVSAGM